MLVSESKKKTHISLSPVELAKLFGRSFPSDRWDSNGSAPIDQLGFHHTAKASEVFVVETSIERTLMLQCLHI